MGNLGRCEYPNCLCADSVVCKFDDPDKYVDLIRPLPPKKSDFVHHEVLDYSKPDIVEYLPDITMIKRRYFHPKTQRIYDVDGFVWDSDLDRWKVSYSREGCITAFVRLPEVFAEKFVEVK